MNENDERKTDAELIEEAEALDAKATENWSTWELRANRIVNLYEYPMGDGTIATGTAHIGGFQSDDDTAFAIAARTLLPELASRLKAANEKLAPFEHLQAATRLAEEARLRAVEAREAAERAGRLADGEPDDGGK